MLRRCLQSEQSYDTDTHFVSYAIQTRDGKRFLALQYQRGLGNEQFALVVLSSAGPHTPGLFGSGGTSAEAIEQDYQLTFNISSEDDVMRAITTEGVNYHMAFVDKGYLDRVLHIFETTSAIRANDVVQALSFLSEKVRAVIHVEINPVELILRVAERVADKKARGYCQIL